jgi:hypothetical protein
MRMGTHASRCTPSGVGRGSSTAERADAGLAEARVAVSGSVCDPGISVDTGERVEDAVAADVGDKDAGEGVREG